MAHFNLGSIKRLTKCLFGKPLFSMTYPPTPIYYLKRKNEEKKKRDKLLRPSFVHSEPWDSGLNILNLNDQLVAIR